MVLNDQMMFVLTKYTEEQLHLSRHYYTDCQKFFHTKYHLDKHQSVSTSHTLYVLKMSFNRKLLLISSAIYFN